MDWQLSEKSKSLTPFTRAVYELTCAIPRGRVSTYGALGVALGVGSGAAQAVGNALHTNPFAPNVPCHRVIKGGTIPSLGGFMGVKESTSLVSKELSKKIALLNDEGVKFDSKLQLVNSSVSLFTAESFDKDIVNSVQNTLRQNKSQIGSKRKRDESDTVTLSVVRKSNHPSLLFKTGLDVRLACKAGILTSNTSGMAPGYAQANLVILPKTFAFDFLLFCTRNHQACPLLEVTSPGIPILTEIASGADIRTDLPKYRIWKNGIVVDEPTNITSLWQDTFVTFLLGCSFSFEEALLKNKIPVRNIEEKKNVPMYRTSIENKKAGPFGGFLVVSMRPMTLKQAEKAAEITSHFPRVHGRPIHIGDPSKIGITDLSKPHYGDAVTMKPNEVPVFWACGVTPQEALIAAKVPFAITHSPGHMFVSDKLNEDLRGYNSGISIK
jgi:O-6-methylguanine DNA methyltransferase